MASKYDVLVLVLVCVFLQSSTCFAQYRLRHPLTQLHLPPGVVGPESIAFDCEGKGPYVGVSDGRILMWQGDRWMMFATMTTHWSPLCTEPSCGRPLGLKFDKATCELYIADSSLGLMKVDRHGGVAKSVVSHFNGAPLKFTNALDIDPHNGAIYFTDTSTRYSRWQWQQAINTLDRTGRLFKYDPKDGSVSVLCGGLAFPNGVALSRDRTFLLLAETTTGQIYKFWLSGPRRHSYDMLLQLGGRPDNINRNADGDFWIAQNPTLPYVRLRGDGIGHPIKIDGSGRVLDHLGDVGSSISDVTEFNNRIWLGSVDKSYVARTM